MRRRLVWLAAWALVLSAVPCLRAQDKFFDSNGVKIRYTDQGQGEPVLLIHDLRVNADLQWGPPGIIGRCKATALALGAGAKEGP
jgi:hypothetical protein